MKERPILMTPENAQKCALGVKTQTRRIMKIQPVRIDGGVPYGDPPEWAMRDGARRGSMMLRCPYGKFRDRLWVRETWVKSLDPANDDQHPECVLYRGAGDRAKKWKPSIHMPRWACRTVLEITEVRVERLQEITEEDATAEIGELETVTHEWVDDCEPGTHAHELATLLIGKQLRAKLSFMLLWESINGKGSWDQNPFVWCISFRKVTHGLD